MRLIKRQTTNLRNIRGKGIQYDIKDQVILDSPVGVLIPKGTTNERPRTPTEGYIRYNTSTNEFEGYHNGQWKKFRYKEPRAIVQQPVGTGDGSTLIFGPLNNGDADFPAPESAASILVFVENVFQISNTNYTLVQNPPTFDPGWYISFNSAPPEEKPITVLHNFDK